MESGRLIEFILRTAWKDIPPKARDRIGLLLRDFVAVSLAGRPTRTARIAAAYAAAQHSGDEATALLDGTRLAASGAAWANGVLGNALDFDDGHRLVKGHPGANVIPSALAVAETVDASIKEFLTAVAIGYEVAIRAGLELHRRSDVYHASGAWGALGAAAAAAHLLSLDEGRTQHALGLAEYHAPMAPIMRSIAVPQMTKDACGWGAQLGTSAALLADRGFTSVPSTFPSAHGATSDLGRRWHILGVYVKRFPCCRWSHPAIDAALRLRQKHQIEPEDVVRVHVRTFTEACALPSGPPETGEEAQYSLVWPVAVALSCGAFGIEHVLEPVLAAPLVRALASRIEVEVDPYIDRAFPERRLAEVRVEARRGPWSSGVTEAPGEPEDPNWADIIESKFHAFAASTSTSPGSERAASFGRRSLEELYLLLGGRRPSNRARVD